MAQETKTRALNRLKSMYALRAEVDKMYEGGVEASDEGKPVAWVMLEGWANPILNAMDVKTVYPENYASVCAAQGVATPFLERSEAEGWPTHLCGYARTTIGYSARMMDLGGKIPPEAPAGGMPKPTVLVSSGVACDARFKWFQSLGRFFDTPVWTLESPDWTLESGMEGAHERNTKFLIGELKAFVAFLEKLLGKKMDWDRLESTGGGTDEINRLRWEINQLRRARPGPMHTRDHWSAMSAALYRGAANPQTITEGFRKMYDEVKYRVDNKIAGINREERYRLSFEGLPPWHSLDFLEQLADRGWNFVIESSYAPTPPRGKTVDVSQYSDPMERYVRSRYGGGGLSQRLDEETAQTKEETRRTGTSLFPGFNRIVDYQCDGTLLHILRSCRALSSDLKLLQQQMLDAIKVPSFVMEGDIIDTSLFNPAEAMRQAEAFEETMDHYRKIRKEAGMAW